MNKTTPSQSKIIHSINNLLTTITLSAEMMAKGIYGPLNSQQKKHLKMVLGEIKKITKLVKKLGKEKT